MWILELIFLSKANLKPSLRMLPGVLLNKLICTCEQELLWLIKNNQTYAVYFSRTCLYEWCLAKLLLKGQTFLCVVVFRDIISFTQNQICIVSKFSFLSFKDASFDTFESVLDQSILTKTEHTNLPQSSASEYLSSLASIVRSSPVKKRKPSKSPQRKKQSEPSKRHKRSCSSSRKHKRRSRSRTSSKKRRSRSR